MRLSKLKPRKQIFKIFTKWVKENRHRFKYKPIAFTMQKSHITFRLERTHPSLKFWFDDHEASPVIFDKHGEMIDMIVWNDYYPKRLSTGQYICAMCDEPKIYDTKEQLLYHHPLEGILNAINQLIQTPHAIIVRSDDITYCNLYQTKEQALNKKTDNGVYINILEHGDNL